ncbi:hypothetical protein H3C66_02950 [Patescibacteria group bacterium]|nr:hypothetical protein [Patescibacteria group bacterium]
MWKELQKHQLAYTVLTIGFLLFIATFLAVWPSRELQRIAIVGLVIFYFLWGVFAHVKSTSFTRRVALEYGAVSVLGGMFLLILTL